jgi:CheY-like chemotaxis protein/HPt (histidine-containing phosphotransfer) domain-containing protein
MAKNIALTSDIGEGVPRIIHGDPARLRLVFLKLLGNAVKFTGSGEIGLDVTIHDDIRGADRIGLEFIIHDTGIGIPEDECLTIFCPFTRADTGTPRAAGAAGMGLSIARQLVEMMAGDIRVESLPSIGVRFIFRIYPRPASEPGQTLGCESNRRDRRILVVEDNPINQQLARQLLIKLGYTATLAESGLEALEALSQKRFDLILMDIMMPGMDGLETTRQIRQREAASGKGEHVPIIAVTANAVAGDKEHCLAAGMDGYVTKPVNPGVLHAEIRRFLTCPDDEPPRLAKSEATPIVDKTEALMRIEDEELYRNLIDMFVADSKTYLAELRLAADTDDRPRLKRAAHTLKGVLATLSAKRAEHAARDLETSVEANDADDRAAGIRRVEDEIATFVAHVRENP